MRLGKYVAVPTVAVERYERRREQTRLSMAKNRYKYDDSRTNHHSFDEECVKTDRKLSREFIMWDGESPQDTGYSLFGNSKGFEICHPFLGTVECLELIMETERQNPDAIHIGFGFNLDVSFITREIPRRQLSALHRNGSCVWQDWELEHIPHKWFRVRRGEIDCRIYDIHTFFMGGYVTSLQMFGVGTTYELEILTGEKARRGEFLWSEINEIRDYWKLELKLGPQLGDALRDALYKSSQYVPISWHGPGAIARMALTRHHVYDAMSECPSPVKQAAQYAFAGGRFELFLCGYAQCPVYEWDINSAYPFYATMLPNLARGHWRRTRHYESGKFAVYNIRYENTDEPFDNRHHRPYPLFRRLENQTVCWPNKVDGWYWAPEAELVADDIHAKFVEGWVFDEDDPNDKPFAWLAEYFHRRKVADKAGSMAGYAFKIIINAIYGQLAQRAGWDKKNNRPPKSHQLEWAGFITSGCRAAVYRAALAAGDKLISINTDSIQALAPIDDVLNIGSELGQWKPTVYEEGIFWQSGIYCLREELGYDKKLGYGWTKSKTRGIPKNSYEAEDLLRCMENDEPLRLDKKVFVTYGLADNGRWDERNTWAIEPHEFVMGGSGKRYHYKGMPSSQLNCKTWCPSPLHVCIQHPMEIDDDNKSKRHYLPWKDGPDAIKTMIDDIMLYDADALDFDDEWVLSYQEGGFDNVV